MRSLPAVRQIFATSTGPGRSAELLFFGFSRN